MDTKVISNRIFGFVAYVPKMPGSSKKWKYDLAQSEKINLQVDGYYVQ